MYRGRTEGLDAGIQAGLAVVLIACPCALGLATPMAVWTAMSRAAQGHVLFRNGQALERLARVDIVYFDKTGTLTDGQGDVNALIVREGTNRRDVMARVAVLAAGSNHVLSMAIRRYAGDAFHTSAITSVQTVPGKGLSAQLVHDGQYDTVYLGSPRFLEEQGLVVSQSLEQSLASAGTDTSLAYVGCGQSGTSCLCISGTVATGSCGSDQNTSHHGFIDDSAYRRPIVGAMQLGKELHSSVMGDQLPEDKVIEVERADLRAILSQWSATVSTTRPLWQRRMWELRWAAAPTCLATRHRCVYCRTISRGCRGQCYWRGRRCESSVRIFSGRLFTMWEGLDWR